MDKRQFDQQVKETISEINRLSAIVDQPERILGEFYETYKPNLLQKVLDFQGYNEDELYDVLISQVGRLPALANCKIARVSKEPLAPMRISYRDPAFELIILDIKAKKYECVYETVKKGLEYRMRDAEVLREEAQGKVHTLKTIDSRVRTIVAGEIPLKKMSFSKRSALKQYMKSLNYSADDIQRACDNTGPFLQVIEENIAKRQSILAEALRELSECQEQKESFENNSYLQNAVRDLIDLLQNSGYSSKSNLFISEQP